MTPNEFLGGKWALNADLMLGTVRMPQMLHRPNFYDLDTQSHVVDTLFLWRIFTQTKFGGFERFLAQMYSQVYFPLG